MSRQEERTKHAITQATIALIKKKPFEKITASDIMEKANVAKSTFYKYYNDKYEIVEEWEKSVLDKIFNMIYVEKPPLLTEKHITASSVPYIEDFELKALCSVHTETVNFLEKFKQRFYDEVMTQKYGKIKSIPARFYASMVTTYFEASAVNGEIPFGEKNPVQNFLLSVIDAAFFIVETPNAESLKNRVIQELESFYFKFDMDD